MHRDLAQPPLTLPPYYVPAFGEDIASCLDTREVCAASSAELNQILTKPLNVFWSHALHSPVLMTFLYSYLRFAPRALG